MSLAFYDDAFVALTLLRTDHDGHLGGISETLVYLRNDDNTRYYTSISASLVDASLTSGWTCKLAYGTRQPTEREWDDIDVNQSLSLPDLGDTAAGDSGTYLPVWVRVYCPGGESAQIRKAQTLSFTAFERLVGA